MKWSIVVWWFVCFLKLFVYFLFGYEFYVLLVGVLRFEIEIEDVESEMKGFFWVFCKRGRWFVSSEVFMVILCVEFMMVVYSDVLIIFFFLCYGLDVIVEFGKVLWFFFEGWIVLIRLRSNGYVRRLKISGDSMGNMFGCLVLGEWLVIVVFDGDW